MTKDYFDILADVATILSAIVTAIAIILAWKQLKHIKKTDEARFWLDLREAFFRHDEIHLKLRKGESLNQNDWAKIDAYMGQFEVCEVMLDEQGLDLSVFKSQYCYRLENILANREIVEEKLLGDEKESWVMFLSLCERCGLEVSKN